MSDRHHIFKYPLTPHIQPATPYAVELPRRHAVIAVDKDPKGDLCLWAIVDSDPDAEKTTIELLVLPTGEDVFDDGKYKQITHLNTVVMDIYVWHIFLVEH
jgi:hypothetical protein